MYRSYLAEEGYAPKIDSDGDVVFKYEGRMYCIVVDEEDEEYFNVVYPGFWPIESESERGKVAQAALHATARVKVVKVHPVRDNTWAAVEMFCSPPEAFKPVFQRSLRALRGAVEKFKEEMHK
jgi:hypothetical protein